MNLCYYAKGSCRAEDYELESFNIIESGIVSLEEIESDDPALVAFRFYTNSKEELNDVVNKFPHLNFECGEEEAKDWDLWWRERQTPVEVSKSLWVRPPWVSFEPHNKDCIVLVLEAKTAFGTGEHDSTALAAQLLESVDLSNKKVLDIGTGTGILSLFALKRGAEFCVGTEIDSLTVDCLVENFEQNGMPKPNVVLGMLNVFNDNIKFDCIVCNMIRTEVLPLRNDIERLINDGGEFILSGQLESEKHFILDWFRANSWNVAEEIISNEWWAVRAICKKV